MKTEKQPIKAEDLVKLKERFHELNARHLDIKQKLSKNKKHA